MEKNYPIIMSNKSEEDVNTWWESKKVELLNGIDLAINKGDTDTEVLKIMKEIVENAKVKSNMSDYYEDLE